LSDNGSTDRTPQVIEAHRSRFPAFRSFRFSENQGPESNCLSAWCKADGERVIYLADDDSLISEGLLHHVAAMEQHKDIAAIYTDWVAWDDQAGSEFRRHYDGLTEFISFDPKAPLDLVNFMFKRFYPPEIGIY